MGIIYFNNSYPYFEWNAIKVSYIYGERYLEQAIQEATTKMVAAELLMADDRSVLIPEGTQNVDLASKIQLWKNEAEKILSRYKEVVYFA
jgi:transcription antitermination factor NusA-like protein